MKFKSGQISMFIIIALLIFILVTFLFFVGNKKEFKEIKNTNVNEIKSNLNYCFEKSYYSALYNIAYHGGKFDKNDKVINTPENLLNFTNRSYYFYSINENLSLPSLEDLEYNFERGISYNFDDCLSKLKKYNLEYDPTEMRIQIDFRENNEIKIEGNLDILVNSTDSKTSFKSFVYTDSESNFLKMYKMAKEIAQKQVQFVPNSCVSCLTEIKRKYKFGLFVEELASKYSTTTIYTIIPENSGYKDSKIFMFALFNNMEVNK